MLRLPSSVTDTKADTNSPATALPGVAFQDIWTFVPLRIGGPAGKTQPGWTIHAAATANQLQSTRVAEPTLLWCSNA